MFPLDNNEILFRFSIIFILYIFLILIVFFVLRLYEFKIEKRSLNALVNTIVWFVEGKDTYTSEHHRRVSRIAAALANKLKMPKDMVNMIYKTAIIHDIGKINIPKEILNKATKLHKSEVEIIRSHPLTGYEIVKDLKFMSPIEKIILQHHERVNGSGYPYGLRSDEIMVEAKIISVADVIEAMSSDRPYGQAYSIDEIIDELNKNSGVLYDESIVFAAIQVLENSQFDLYKI